MGPTMSQDCKGHLEMCVAEVLPLLPVPLVEGYAPMGPASCCGQVRSFCFSDLLGLKVSFPVEKLYLSGMFQQTLVSEPFALGEV